MKPQNNREMENPISWNILTYECLHVRYTPLCTTERRAEHNAFHTINEYTVMFKETYLFILLTQKADRDAGALIMVKA